MRGVEWERGEGRREEILYSEARAMDGWGGEGEGRGGGRRSDRGLYERGIAEVGLEDAVLYCK